ncbi:MAG: ferrous iron transport protein B [Bdellovibrionales bacterium RIFCSPHIGHO2_01_FULL_40_29]|nr:MAG: ferrous iron transport protein B [Bdellovibrionales bacterium RIFCSPHIGHO2_01_FULL_40_29]OFZ34223.1 MAG: ferrous iron transport protein B [Bdellovibrionales bacterium RIFCSPHIGHO2_02_FULL_40_15]
MSAWVLVGSPNSGKTTLYNWLTGSKFKTVNYPGATVEYSVGLLQNHLSGAHAGYAPVVIDTPGIYSLQVQSEDEQVTFSTLFLKKAEQKEITGVVCVLDGTQLSRHLVLAEQLRQTGYPIVFVVTMSDLLYKNKVQLDLEKLEKELGFPIVLFDGLLGAGLEKVVLSMKASEEFSKGRNLDVKVPEWSMENQQVLMKKSVQLAERVTSKQNRNLEITRITRQIDSLLLHPVFGFIFFFIFMTLLFSAIYWMAAPVMDIIDSAFGWLADVVTNSVPGLVGNFLGAGLIAAIGGVVIFVPQIFILFLGIGILESTGYLARVAALIDRPLSWIGLGGRSFVPLLSGFACAIPAIMATRNISSKKERLIAQSVIPFMTCSARLPVFALMISFLFSESQPLLAGAVMALLYFFAIFVGAVASGILSRLIASTQKPRLMMELPLYRRPRFKVLLTQSVHRSKSFLSKAGPIILVLAIILWFATNFPRPDVGVEMSDSEISQQSYAAKVGQKIEPLFIPMGLDWRAGFGLISAFAAREVFVSALALVFNIEGDGEAQTESLLQAMRTATFADGKPIFTVASVVGILIFFSIALQCISTVGILKRESGSWNLALMQLLISNVAAYILAVSVVQILKAMGY